MIFPCFNTTGKHKFHLFDLATEIDGLLGIEFLKYVKGSINFSSNTFETPSAIFPLQTNQQTEPYFQSISFQPQYIVIPPRTTQEVIIPVNQSHGIGI